MAAEARFAIRERDDLKHRLRHCQNTLDEYITTIQQQRATILELRQELELLKLDLQMAEESLKQWRDSEFGELEV
jgi:flagellar biosynthesis chaperone FliJ